MTTTPSGNTTPPRHTFLPGCPDKQALLNLLDDATRYNVGARLYPSETLLAHLDFLSRIFQTHGLPPALYVDYHSFFFIHTPDAFTQLGEALHYPAAFLQFTDDNLLADRDYAAELLALLRRKRRRFVTMVTLDQFCDGALMQEMASSGCLGVAVGIESVDDDNCVSVGKHQNVGQPFPEAVRQVNEQGMQVCALLLVGLSHDTPEGLARAQRYLEQVPCSLYDLRTLRVYPSSPLYDQMLSCGNVTEAWWLGKETVSSNHFLPGHLRMHFQHGHLSPMQLQYWALKLTSELDRMKCGTVGHALRVGRRGRALKFATTLLSARQRTARQARTLLRRVEQAMAANAQTPLV